ncbi:cytochrome d ubiquinol oxidase subunit II [Streptosporangium saharense]|uniref:Cytochrome d ubiquinol oxidase subunit II n=1 Tax=Streptosporangium saharense TaxID=1706840 RepID=A0A7W7QSS0_9ACTN|nr:cytochrome d ubiquinol oxidase subunit II [Streptosporangium saharense]MBB4918889.1 cytochrome d ubiquinol oxidase subunit II [Streptosporangium saharense]
MDLAWYGLLGTLFGGYLALDGTAIGAGILLRASGYGERARRATITSFGPFFLGNEVWLVMTVATLLAVFPRLEGLLFHGHYPLIVAVLLIWLVRDGSVWFRSRVERPGWRRGWDRVLVGTSVAFAAGLGLLVGNLLVAVPGAGTVWMPFGWYPLLWALTTVSVFTVHGASFLAVRMPDDLARASVRTVRRWASPAAALTAVAVVLGGVIQSGAVTVVTGAPAVLALFAAGRVVTGRPRFALLLTALAAATPAALVGVRLLPAAERSFATEAALATLEGPLTIVLPAVAALQLWTWWVFLRRIDSRTTVFF